MPKSTSTPDKLHRIMVNENKETTASRSAERRCHHERTWCHGNGGGQHCVSRGTGRSRLVFGAIVGRHCDDGAYAVAA